MLSEIVIVPYNVYNGRHEFRMAGLDRETLDFFRVNVNEIELLDWSEIRELSDEYLGKVLHGYVDVSFELEEEKMVGDVLYLIYKVSMNHLNSYVWRDRRMVFVTMSEILNEGKVGGTLVNEGVAEVVNRNSVYFLTGDNPSVFYTYSHRGKVEFESLFGRSREDKGDGNGYTFHFSEYEDIPCRIRYAVFLGNVCYGEDVDWENRWDSRLKEGGVCVSDYGNFHPLSYEI